MLRRNQNPKKNQFETTVYGNANGNGFFSLIPYDILGVIYSYLPIASLGRIAQVCRAAYNSLQVGACASSWGKHIKTEFPYLTIDQPSFKTYGITYQKQYATIRNRNNRKLRSMVMHKNIKGIETYFINKNLKRSWISSFTLEEPLFSFMFERDAYGRSLLDCLVEINDQTLFDTFFSIFSPYLPKDITSKYEINDRIELVYWIIVLRQPLNFFPPSFTSHLFDHNAKHSYSILELAAKYRSMPFVTYLLSSDSKALLFPSRVEGKFLFEQACCYQWHEAVTAIITRMKTVNANDVNVNMDVVRWVLLRCFLDALKKQDITLIKAIIDYKPEILTMDERILILVAREANVAILDYLKDKMDFKKIVEGYSMLHYALFSQNKNLEAVKYLIDSGLQLTLSNEILKSLLFAPDQTLIDFLFANLKIDGIANVNVSALEKLLAYLRRIQHYDQTQITAFINLRDTHGKTALECADRLGKSEMISVLVKNGASVPAGMKTEKKLPKETRLLIELRRYLQERSAQGNYTGFLGSRINHTITIFGRVINKYNKQAKLPSVENFFDYLTGGPKAKDFCESDIPVLLDGKVNSILKKYYEGYGNLRKIGKRLKTPTTAPRMHS